MVAAPAGRRTGSGAVGGSAVDSDFEAANRAGLRWQLPPSGALIGVAKVY